MAVKPNGRLLAIREQIVYDRASGLTLQFELREDGVGAMRVFGPLPHGDLEMVFDHSGAVRSLAPVPAEASSRPSWLKSVG
jgi:hypothetical protein